MFDHLDFAMSVVLVAALILCAMVIVNDVVVFRRKRRSKFKHVRFGGM